MSLAIDPDNVTHVLLADGWHACDFDCTRANDKEKASSFCFDAYEYFTEYWNFDQLKTAFHTSFDGVGFTFNEEGITISGPASSIIAVKHYHKDVTMDPNYTKHLAEKKSKLENR